MEPLITEQNKKGRLHFCLSISQENILPYNSKFKDIYNPKFKDIYNMFHVSITFCQMRMSSHMQEQELYGKGYVFSRYSASTI